MNQENFLWGAPRIHGELLKLSVPLRVYRAIIDLAPGAAISLFQSY
jgi:hypothetical protein